MHRDMSCFCKFIRSHDTRVVSCVTNMKTQIEQECNMRWADQRTSQSSFYSKGIIMKTSTKNASEGKTRRMNQDWPESLGWAFSMINLDVGCTEWSVSTRTPLYESKLMTWSIREGGIRHVSHEKEWTETWVDQEQYCKKKKNGRRSPVQETRDWQVWK